MSHRTVCIVDDDLLAANSVKALVQTAGIEASVFESAESFLDNLFAKRLSDLGCIIIDIRLPGMSGIALQKEIRNRNIDVPTILVTGHASEELRAIGLTNGAQCVLEKPYDGRVLLEEVEKHCAPPN